MNTVEEIRAVLKPESWKRKSGRYHFTIRLFGEEVRGHFTHNKDDLKNADIKYIDEVMARLPKLSEEGSRLLKEAAGQEIGVLILVELIFYPNDSCELNFKRLGHEGEDDLIVEFNAEFQPRIYIEIDDTGTAGCRDIGQKAVEPKRGKPEKNLRKEKSLEAAGAPGKAKAKSRSGEGKREQKNVSFLLLFARPFINSMVYMIILYLMILFMPKLLLALMPLEKMHPASAILLPTFIGNAILILYIVIGIIVLFIKLFKWNKRLRLKAAEEPNPALNFQTRSKMFLVGLTMIALSILVSSPLFIYEDGLAVTRDNLVDYLEYKTDIIEYYYGTLEQGGEFGLNVPYYGSGDLGGRVGWQAVLWPHQGWRAGRNFTLFSSSKSEVYWETEEGVEYRVGYLPRTKTICSIEVLDRTADFNQVGYGMEVLMSSNVRDHYRVSDWFAGDYAQKNHKEFADKALDEHYNAFFTVWNLDDNYWDYGWGDTTQNLDYFLMAGSEEEGYDLMVLETHPNSFAAYTFPENIYSDGVKIYVLNSKSFYLKDFLFVWPDGTEAILRFDGQDRFYAEYL